MVPLSLVLASEDLCWVSFKPFLSLQSGCPIKKEQEQSDDVDGLVQSVL